MGLLLFLGGYVRASYHGMSQQQKIHMQQPGAVAYGQSTVTITLLCRATFAFLCEETFQRP